MQGIEIFLQLQDTVVKREQLGKKSWKSLKDQKFPQKKSIWNKNIALNQMKAKGKVIKPSQTEGVWKKKIIKA